MIILDIETSGLDPAKSSVVSIGAMDFNEPSQIFYDECQIWPNAQVDKNSLDILGMSEDQLRDPSKQMPEQLITKFLKWLEKRSDKTIAGQNVHWDTAFLREELKKSGKIFHFGMRIIDLHSLCYTKMLEKSLHIPLRNSRTDLDLDVIMHFVGISQKRKTHNALEDVRLEAECFYRLMFGQPFLPEFSEDKVNPLLAKS